MRTKHILFTMAVVVAIQLYIPASIIYKSECILKSGAKYLFRTAPIDPGDAFRGKYVQLAFEEDSLVNTDGGSYNYGSVAYVSIIADKAGFAKVVSLSVKKPINGDYVKVKIRSNRNNQVHFAYSFDRFYLEEGIAPKAEKMYRTGNISGKQDSYAVVRIKTDTALLEDLWIGGRSVREAIK